MHMHISETGVTSKTHMLVDVLVVGNREDLLHTASGQRDLQTGEESMTTMGKLY